MSNKSDENKTNVQVAVRCRPLNENEKRQGSGVIVCDAASKSVNVKYGPSNKRLNKTFNFDKVFSTYSTQEDVFRTTVKPIINDVMIGMNCTLFAYGQTGTGKTHTMEGDINSDENAGIIPRSVKSIIEKLEAGKAEYTVRVSYMELYNEVMQDLLVDPNDRSNPELKLCEDLKNGVVCNNLTETSVLTIDDIFKILNKGISNRKTAATLCNKQSSRSHSIFTMKIMIKESTIEGEEVIRQGQLNLVDLAGSECVGRSGAKEDRAREAGNINKSLLTLGRVITALVDNHRHIPYRDSKLTRLLQDSLGGKAKTCIIATFSPSHLCVEETLSTLDYANRAKSIKNAPQVNEKMNKKVLLKGFCSEIESLKAQLQATQEKNGVYVPPDEWQRINGVMQSQEGQLAECEAALKEREELMKEIQKEHAEMSNKLEVKENELKTKISELSSALSTIDTLNTNLNAAKQTICENEAIISEQITTERALTKTAESLKSELMERRREIDVLVSKIESLYSLDTSKTNMSKTLTDTLESQKDKLGELLVKISGESNEFMQCMRGDVQSMLQKGEEISSTLTSCIEKAITNLGSDTQTIQSNLAESSKTAAEAFKSSDEVIMTSLKNAQQEMTTWTKSLSAQLTDIHSDLNNHNEAIGSIGNNVSEVNNQIQEFLNNNLKSQETTMNENIKMMMEKSEIAKEQLCKIVSDLMDTQATQLIDSLSAGKILTTKVRGSLDTKFNDLQTTISSISEENETTQKKASDVAVHILEQGDAFGKRFGSVVDTVHLSIETGLQQVHTIDTNVNEMSGAVEAASSKLLEDTSSAIQDQKSMMNDQLGTEFINNLENFRTNILKEMEDEGSFVVGLGNMHQTYDKYGSDMVDMKAKPEGSTPKKIRDHSLPVLKRTRSHNAIRADPLPAVDENENSQEVVEEAKSEKYAETNVTQSSNTVVDDENNITDDATVATEKDTHVRKSDASASTITSSNCSIKSVDEGMEIEKIEDNRSPLAEVPASKSNANLSKTTSSDSLDSKKSTSLKGKRNVSVSNISKVTSATSDEKDSVLTRSARKTKRPSQIQGPNSRRRRTVVDDSTENAEN